MTDVLFRVGLVLSPRPWSTRLHSFIADHTPNVELAMVRDQRAALECAPHVLLIDESTPWLTSAFVAQARTAGIRLVGVYERAPGRAGQVQLAELGISHQIEEAMPPEDVVFLIGRLRPTGRPGDDVSLSVAVDETVTSGRGVVVSVGGPSGSGAREVAVGLGRALGARGWRTLLVDANEATPGVAQRLGLSVYPHILTAIERRLTDGVNGIGAALAGGPGHRTFDVIAGLPSTRDWDRLLASDVEALFDSCRDGWDFVLVTTSPIIEDLQRWGNRYGVSRRALATADAVVGCCEPSPRGAVRFIDWLAEVGILRLRSSDVLTVLNKVPGSRRAAAEVAGHVRDAGRFYINDLFEVPFDRRVEAAEWDGSEVGRGPFSKAVGELATVLETYVAREMAVAR